MPSDANSLWGRTLCPTFSPQELELAEKHGISIIPITSSAYPQALKILSDAPLALYVKGTLPPEEAMKVGIVGTRNATPLGLECTTSFAKYLCNCGAWIISGLARGIDTSAHKASLGRTVAILGSGLLHIYPKENEALARSISEQGALISELPLMTPPSKFTFPRRNRLISALSHALLLTEAPLKSGAMITMRCGINHKKPLFALPGPSMNENYGGNHSLLKARLAQLVESPQELALALQLQLKSEAPKCKNLFLLLPQEQKILDFICQSALSIDELSQMFALPTSTLQAILSKLVLKKLAVELPGKRYKGNV